MIFFYELITNGWTCLGEATYKQIWHLTISLVRSCQNVKTKLTYSQRLKSYSDFHKLITDGHGNYRALLVSPFSDDFTAGRVIQLFIANGCKTAIRFNISHYDNPFSCYYQTDNNLKHNSLLKLVTLNSVLKHISLIHCGLCGSVGCVSD